MLKVLHRMEARFALWQATGRADHLDAAVRLLDGLRDGAPEEDRESMVRNVALHREIDASRGGGRSRASEAPTAMG